MLCEILKGVFDISHKRLDPYTTKLPTHNRYYGFARTQMPITEKLTTRVPGGFPSQMARNTENVSVNMAISLGCLFDPDKDLSPRNWLLNALGNFLLHKRFHVF